jgi:SAM-dependent methyltransferase
MRVVDGRPAWGAAHWVVKKGIHDALIQTAPFLRGRLLDLGCGSSPYLYLPSPAVETRWGYDLRSSPQGRSADVIGDVQSLAFGDQLFDAVLCTEVVEHVPRPDEVFSEIRRVLRPGGCLVLTAPFLFGLHEEPRDFNRYTKHMLWRLSSDHGLAVVACDTTGGLFAAIGQLISYHIPHSRFGPADVAMRLLRLTVQWPLWQLDRRFPKTRDPLGYILVARRTA